MTAVAALPPARTPDAIVQLAQGTFERRLAAAQRQVDGGHWSHVEADARLYPWLALALRCGAEPPQVADRLAELRKANLPDRTARCIVADDLCSLPDLRAEMRRALAAATTNESQGRVLALGTAAMVLGSADVLAALAPQHLGQQAHQQPQQVAA